MVVPVKARETVFALTVGVASATPSKTAGVSTSMSAPDEKVMISGEEIATAEVNWTATVPQEPEAQPLDIVSLLTR